MRGHPAGTGGAAQAAGQVAALRRRRQRRRDARGEMERDLTQEIGSDHYRRSVASSFIERGVLGFPVALTTNARVSYCREGRAR